HTTAPSLRASASKPKVSRSTSRTKRSVNPGLAQQEERLLGREEIRGDAPHEVALEHPPRRDRDAARNHLEHPRAEVERLAAIDRVDRARDLEARALVARRQEEELVGDLQLRDAAEARVTRAGQIADVAELLQHVGAALPVAGHDEPACLLGLPELEALRLERLHHPRPETVGRLAHQPEMLAAHVLLRIGCRPPQSAAGHQHGGSERDTRSSVAREHGTKPAPPNPWRTSALPARSWRGGPSRRGSRRGGAAAPAGPRRRSPGPG